jgi:hypothetical protein
LIAQDIRHTANVYPSAIGVWIGNAGENRIQHNEIHHFNHTDVALLARLVPTADLSAIAKRDKPA